MPFPSSKARMAFYASQNKKGAGVPFQGNSAPPMPTLPSGLMSGISGLPNQVPNGLKKPRFKQLSSLIKSPLGKPQ